MPPKKPDAGVWTDTEDQVIRDEMAKDGSLRLKLVSMNKLLPQRTERQIKEHYVQLGLRKREGVYVPWKKEEDDVILAHMGTLDSTPFTQIAALLTGRTASAVKHRILRHLIITPEEAAKKTAEKAAKAAAAASAKTAEKVAAKKVLSATKAAAKKVEKEEEAASAQRYAAENVARLQREGEARERQWGC